MTTQSGGRPVTQNRSPTGSSSTCQPTTVRRLLDVRGAEVNESRHLGVDVVGPEVDVGGRRGAPVVGTEALEQQLHGTR